MRRFDRRALATALQDARKSTLALAGDLGEAQWQVSRLAIVNPKEWELGPVGWFAESWCLRWAGMKRPLPESVRADPFEPCAGFASDPCLDYSPPWFHRARRLAGPLALADG